MRHPKVLLLGNGINRAYGEINWKELMQRISVRDDLNADQMNSPYPIQAILLTNNNIKDAMAVNKHLFYGSINHKQQSTLLKTLLSIGFDDILTTNYSYELEEAALGFDSIEKTDNKKIGQITRLMKNTCGHAETRYMFHTYNDVSYCGIKNRIWHIHGESRKPDSMVLGHYWYGSLLAKMKTIIDENRNSYQSQQAKGEFIEYKSWLDSFIMGDVYILGYDYNLYELDMWWLLNRKAREKANVGTVFFYEPENGESKEKTELLKLMKVQHLSLGKSITHENKDDPVFFRHFYTEAINDIKKRQEH